MFHLLDLSPCGSEFTSGSDGYICRDGSSVYSQIIILTVRVVVYKPWQIFIFIYLRLNRFRQCGHNTLKPCLIAWIIHYALVSKDGWRI